MAPAWRATALACMVLGLTACGPSWSPEKPEQGAEAGYRVTPDGYYRVRRGDTLYAIAFNFGLDWRELARWNDLAKPDLIYPDQQLRMSPPAGRTATVETRPAPAATSTTRAVEIPAETRAQTRDATPAEAGGQPDAASAAEAEPGTAVAAEPAPAQAPAPAQEPAKQPPAAAAPPGRWLWPTEGRVLSTFRANDPSRNGIDIGGADGQAVVAAAAGEVVYSGNGLIGYGELVIIKHDDRRLSAYAHNRRRLVSEGQRVAAGDAVAEMGRNDRNQAMLHFEVRVDGAPQDPLKFLAPR